MLSPWNIVCTIIPILFSLSIVLVKIFLTREFIRVDKKIYSLAALFGVIAGYFFYKGLDDLNDYLRLNHGLWHFFAGIAIYLFYLGKEIKTEKII